MDREEEANLPVLPVSAPNNRVPSSNRELHPQGLLRNVQAAFKRHRPLGTTRTNTMKPRRCIVRQSEGSGSSDSFVDTTADKMNPQYVVSLRHSNAANNLVTHSMSTSVVKDSQEDASIAAPSPSVTISKTFGDGLNSFDMWRSNSNFVTCGTENLSQVESQHVDSQRKVQFLTGNSVISHGTDDRMATGLENLSSHMSSLTLAEMEWDACNQAETSSAIVNDKSRLHNFPSVESDSCLKSDAAVYSSLETKRAAVKDNLQQFRNFLNQPVTQSSVVGSSCATTTSIHSTSAPMRNATTFVSHSHQEGNSQVTLEHLEELNVNHQPVNQGKTMKSSLSSVADSSILLSDQKSIEVQAGSSTANTEVVKEYYKPKEQECSITKGSEAPQDSSFITDKLNKEQGFAGHVNAVQSTAPVSKNLTLEPTKLGKQEKAASVRGASAPRKRNYDPEFFFKVNGKLYQRLGKIGSGGSSEVHKVISSDCKIFALKKIKLKGRDYATAYGFCQEIEYLNKLKGKNNIIQLKDYEVTDKTLIREVLNGSMSNKDIRVKDDGYIYMVLEYGEIDLAHMLFQKWKEIDGINQTIDENWLRFYWQQILQAINTIHEERIVHSDLKPDNFLLVKGSLKLIDFGIAKAIMNDTTNIQRDSQVGTLSYMSPEAFMCNESDSNGNTIKCGRASDIWSLGCILYQMVYGRTPFAEYKTFWAKFKVTTDPNHDIKYEPVSNPWLLDLMKKCLAWDQNKRWRIPQLLKHPFLAPPLPPQISPSKHQSCSKLVQLVAEACGSDQEALVLCSQLDRLLYDPETNESLNSRDNHCTMLYQLSNLCSKLRGRFPNSD